MHWYLIHTKPRQEVCALQHLERQGYVCYLPLATEWRQRAGQWVRSDVPMFSRYLFIQLDVGLNARSWGPIRSTRGVSRLVSFGTQPAIVADELVAHVRVLEAAARASPTALFEVGDVVRIAQGAFAGLQGLVQEMDGERRAMVLIEMMSRPVAVRVESAQLRRVV